MVEAGLDLVAGDRIALATTSYGPNGEDAIVSAYDDVTGQVTLT